MLDEVLKIPFDEVCRSGWPMYALLLHYFWNEDVRLRDFDMKLTDFTQVPPAGDLPEALKTMTRRCVSYFEVNFSDLTWCLG